MSIVGDEGISPGSFYTTNGRDVWRVDYVCPVASIALRNLVTGEVLTAGVGSLALEPFVPMIPQTKQMNQPQPQGVRLSSGTKKKEG